MDGNRRYAKLRGHKAVWGHWKGATTWLNLIDWWSYYLKSNESRQVNYMTMWALSKENLQRSAEELAGLFVVLTATFRSIAFTSSIHRSQIRVRFIGTLADLPQHVLDAIKFLEKETESYSCAIMLVAVGYGGRDEVLRAVREVLESGEELNEDSISRKTFCSKISVPPVDLIIRTSESRTSGFMLWDTQTTELHFIHNKMWPELTESDCIHALESFASREKRGGK
ncbi:Undecaprenyl diphosphate synthase [Gymnopus androsaceus JB14]|uniref:Alkyl transferase n=1 Tax=Gymnopus androsaceus JB14 TaxID=1447944 RepID=A0A6A4HHE4_9AGAR|nr:Undecaprenyl diphosphate synthase [Gymnopus androsaceus JB14]